MKEKKIIDKWIKFSELQKEIYENLTAEVDNRENQLNLNEFYSLYFLNLQTNKKMRLQDLGYKVGLSPSAMSRMIAKLEVKSCEVIKKEICIEDKRNIYVKITPRGEEKLESALKVVNNVLEKYKDQL